MCLALGRVAAAGVGCVARLRRRPAGRQHAIVVQVPALTARPLDHSAAAVRAVPALGTRPAHFSTASFAKLPEVERSVPFGSPRRIVFSDVVSGMLPSTAFGVGQPASASMFRAARLCSHHGLPSFHAAGGEIDATGVGQPADSVCCTSPVSQSRPVSRS